jgi:hypothetical protein
MPRTRPELIAPDTFLIPNLAPGPDGLYLPVNSMVIRGREPVIVDTGAPVHRDQWLEKAFAVVEPEDVRWVFLSHDDGDHTGALLDVLERCPNATLVTNFFSVERLALEKPALPLARMRWIEPGGSFDAGDRVLQIVPPAGLRRSDLARPVRREDRRDVDRRQLRLLHARHAGRRRGAARTAGAGDAGTQQRDLALARLAGRPAAYTAACARSGGAGRSTAASAHGPVLRGERLDDAFDRLRALAGHADHPDGGTGTARQPARADAGRSRLELKRLFDPGSFSTALVPSRGPHRGRPNVRQSGAVCLKRARSSCAARAPCARRQLRC